MTGLEEAHKGEVATGLDLAIGLVLELLGSIGRGNKVLKVRLGKVLVARPLELVGPSLVSEPVADEVNITSVDKNRDLLQDLGDKLVVGLHPITGKHEVAVNVEVATVIAVDLGTDGLADLLLVKELGDPAHGRVAQVGGILARSTNVVDVATGALVGTHHGVVAVDGGRDARPGTAGVVAALNQGLTTGQSAVHTLALALAQDRLVATFAASHGAVVSVLGVRVGQTVTNEHTLEVDVALLVRQNLGSEDRNIVTSVGFTSNVEVLLRVLGKLVEEEGEKGVDVLASSDSVADAIAAV